jgi:hypothetical protein
MPRLGRFYASSVLVWEMAMVSQHYNGLPLPWRPRTASADATTLKFLHPEVASRLRTWLESKKDLSEKDLLFSISAKVPGGIERRTSKMMRVDLKAARKKWIEEAKTPKEKTNRENSDFLKYQNSAGQFADFHSNRHTFITNLERAGV